MAYHTQDDLEDRWTAERIAEIYSVQATDGTTTGEADATAVAAMVADVDAEIDSILGGVFDTPLSPVDPLITAIACDMNPWRGIQRRPAMMVDARNQPYKLLHDEAIAKLRDIRDGKRIISANHVAANVGGEVIDTYNVEGAQPHYFTRDPSTGEGGLGGF